MGDGDVAGATHTHRVAVIEDDSAQREALMEFLAGQGWEVAGAADGREALTVLATAKTPCVIFLDLMMVGMDGWRFMDELRVLPTLASIPIVVMSGYGTEDGVRMLGAADYLHKPFRLIHAAEMVRQLCPLDART
jgi:CheY-like chemotaxis protein